MSDRSNQPIDGGPSGVDLLRPADAGGAPEALEKTPSRRRWGVTGRVDEGALPMVFVVLVGVVTVGGLLLRLPSFNDSLFGDEISTYYIVVGNSLGRVITLVHSNQETTPPLYFVVAWATKGILGSPVQSIRLVSLITGTAAIPLTFLLGLWTVGRRAGLVGAVCVALSPYMIFFSTEARPYMLVLFLALLSTLALHPRWTPAVFQLVGGLCGLLICCRLHPLHRGLPTRAPSWCGPCGLSPGHGGHWWWPTWRLACPISLGSEAFGRMCGPPHSTSSASSTSTPSGASSRASGSGTPSPDWAAARQPRRSPGRGRSGHRRGRTGRQGTGGRPSPAAHPARYRPGGAARLGPGGRDRPIQLGPGRHLG